MKRYIAPVLDRIMIDPRTDLLTASGELTERAAGGGSVWDLSNLSV